MFLEGSTVRLVTSVTRGSAGLVVGTAPASITDVITNGNIAWDTPVNFADAVGMQGAGVPVEGTLLPALSAGDSDLATPDAPMTRLRPRYPALGTGGKGMTLKGKAGGYGYSLSLTTAGRAATVTITLSRTSPVELSFTAAGTIQNFTTEGAIDIQKAKMAKASVDMNGLSGDFTLSYELKPLTAFGLGAAGGFKLTLPAEVTIPFEVPLPPGSIPPFLPMFLGVKVAVYIAVGFSNKNQSIKGAYTVHYGGQAGFSVSPSGATTGEGVMQGIGKVVLDQANAIMNGPISLVLGAQIPQIEVGLGGKGLNVAGFVDLIADTAIKVGGGFGGQTGCDARDLRVMATAGAKAAFFGLSMDLGSATLFSQDFNASWPPGCGTAGV
jgi:hypothetical protein